MRTLMTTVVLFAMPVVFAAPTIPADFKTYHNAAVGFEISYPKDLTFSTSFKEHTILMQRWSAVADDSPGYTTTGESQLARVTLEDVRQPDFSYYAAVRFGSTTNPEAVKNCYTTRSCPMDNCELPYRVINGTTFHSYVIEEAGMSKYLQGVGYRYRKDKTCYALEIVSSGFNQSDGRALAKLRKKYSPIAEQIVNTFEFTKKSAG